jgi:general secretion pathway protein C
LSIIPSHLLGHITAYTAKLEQRLRALTAKLPPRSLRLIIYAILIVWLLYGLSQFVWQWIVNTQALDDTIQLQSLNLFGHQDAAAAQAARQAVDDIAANAETTSLAMQLQGIVYSDTIDEAVAIIEIKGTAAQYRIDDKLPFSHQVVLSRILPDRIIINNNGRYESVWLFADDNASGITATSARPARTTRTTSNTPSPTSLAREYRDQLYENPSSLAQAIQITPLQRDGQMVGYRVAPGRDKEQFTTLGFEAGDVITSINGIPLDDPAQAIEIYRLMLDADEAVFTIERDGQPIELSIDFDE